MALLLPPLALRKASQQATEAVLQKAWEEDEYSVGEQSENWPPFVEANVGARAMKKRKSSQNPPLFQGKGF